MSKQFSLVVSHLKHLLFLLCSSDQRWETALGLFRITLSSTVKQTLCPDGCKTDLTAWTLSSWALLFFSAVFWWDLCQHYYSCLFTVCETGWLKKTGCMCSRGECFGSALFWLCRMIHGHKQFKSRNECLWGISQSSVWERI